MPQHQSSDDDPVEDGELPPSGGQKFACAPAVAVVEAVQREEGHDSVSAPRIMARVLITDGLDVKRESASIETFKPAAAESRSLKTRLPVVGCRPR